MQDRPTTVELLDAIERFLRGQSAAQQDRWLRFQLLVCANSLGIVRRELELEEGFVRDEWKDMGRLIGPAPIPESFQDTVLALRERNDELCRRIRSGEFDSPEKERPLVDFFVKELVNKVRITAPGELS
jgi:hypothetical protein